MFSLNLTPKSMSPRIAPLALVVACWMTAFSGRAQQDVLTGQYLFNGMLINPAYAGASGQWETMAMQRLQWVEFDGAPNTGIVSGHGALANRELGVGGMLAVDAVGITSTFELSGHAAYHLDMGQSDLSFGLRGGLLQYRAQLGEVDVIDPSDPVYQGTQLSAWVPRFGFGALFRRNNWFVGASAPMLFVFDKALDGGISPYYRNHMYLQGGMNLKANSWLTLAPSVLFRSTPEVPIRVGPQFGGHRVRRVHLGARLPHRQQLCASDAMPNQQPISHRLHARLHSHGHPNLRGWHPRNRVGLGLEPTCQGSHAAGHVTSTDQSVPCKKGKPDGLPFFVSRLEAISGTPPPSTARCFPTPPRCGAIGCTSRCGQNGSQSPF